MKKIFPLFLFSLSLLCSHTRTAPSGKGIEEESEAFILTMVNAIHAIIMKSSPEDTPETIEAAISRELQRETPQIAELLCKNSFPQQRNDTQTVFVDSPEGAMVKNLIITIKKIITLLASMKKRIPQEQMGKKIIERIEKKIKKLQETGKGALAELLRKIVGWYKKYSVDNVADHDETYFVKKINIIDQRIKQKEQKFAFSLRAQRKISTLFATKWLNYSAIEKKYLSEMSNLIDDFLKK